MLIASDAQLDELDGRDHFRPARNLELWARVPAELRRAHFTAHNLPSHPAFRWRTEHPKWLELDLRGLPGPMQRELAYAFWRLIEQGLGLNGNYRQLVWRLGQMLDDRRAAGRPAPQSLMELSLREWEREWRLSRARRKGRLALAVNQWAALRRCYQHLAIAYDPREWWQHDLWNPKLDRRIPLREHEPIRMNAGYDFLAIEQPWLRDGLKWHCKVRLEAGSLRWPTVRARLHALTLFSRFLAERGVDEPRLAASAAKVRVLALDFLGELRGRRQDRGRNRGRPLAGGTLTTLLCDIEQFYAFMADHRHEAAERLGEPRWLAVGDEHARLWRAGEKPAMRRGPAPDRGYFDDVTMGQVTTNAGLLGAPACEGGVGDEQAMRLLMLLVRTGRRVSELRLLDFDCLLPLQALPDSDGEEGALVAKLRYQQTKIDGAAGHHLRRLRGRRDHPGPAAMGALLAATHTARRREQLGADGHRAGASPAAAHVEADQVGLDALHVLVSQGERLGDVEAGAVEELDQDAVAQASGAARRGLVEHGLDLPRVQIGAGTSHGACGPLPGWA